MNEDKDNALSPAGRKIAKALTGFRDALAAGEDISKTFTVRTMTLNLQPRPYTPEDVKKTRLLLKASQGVFARYLGVSVKTIRSWEQGDRSPSSMACRFMDEINHSPDYWVARLNDSMMPRDKDPAKA